MKGRVQLREPRRRKHHRPKAEERSEPRDRNCTRAFGVLFSRSTIYVNLASSGFQVAAVDGDRLAGDPGALLREEHGDDVADLLRLPDPVQDVVVDRLRE